ncbi:MAG: DUF402 domain-containing protein [Pyrinomonadaceae bacterium]
MRGTLIILEAVFDEEIKHPLLGIIKPGTQSFEYYWTDRWYSIFRFSEPTGELRNYYCNINTPPRLENRLLSFIDLDIDILVAPDFSYEILDEDEFSRHAEHYKYPQDLQVRVRRTVTELISLIERRGFPFTQET